MTAQGPAFAAGSAADPFRESRDPEARAQSLECLTQAIYYEARNQSADGQRAVAQVVLNRARHPDYPNSVCGVVFQGSRRTTGCQFSFTCDGSINAGVNDRGAWARAERIAEAALDGSVYRPVGLALNYHTTAIMPYWAPSLVQQAVVGDHIFYRRPNSTLDAFSQPQAERPVRVERGVERRDRTIEPAWTSRDSAALRRVLRQAPSPRLREIGLAIEEIPVFEQPVRYRTIGGGRSSVRPERAPRRAPRRPRPARASRSKAGPGVAGLLGRREEARTSAIASDRAPKVTKVTLRRGGKRHLLGEGQPVERQIGEHGTRGSSARNRPFPAYAGCGGV